MNSASGGPQHQRCLPGSAAGSCDQRARVRQAIPLLERTLADFERVLGATHPDTLTSRNNLAHAYQAAGRLREAEILCRSHETYPAGGLGPRDAPHEHLGATKRSRVRPAGLGHPAS